MKPDLFYLSAHLPSAAAPQGGHKTAYRHLRWLAEEYRLHLFSFYSPHDGKKDQAMLDELCASTCICAVNNWTRLRGVMSRPKLPTLVAARWNAEMARKLHEAAKDIRPSRLHIEWTQLTSYIPAVRSASASTRVTLNIHDVLAQRAVRQRQRTRWSLWRKLDEVRTPRWERKAMAQCDEIFAPSRKDVELLTQLSDSLRGRVFHLPPPFDVRRPLGARDFSNAGHCLFWGALNRKENSEAAFWLVENIFSPLRERVPDASLTVAGANPPKDLRAHAQAGLEITGFLDDPGPVFARSHVALLPLFSGAGIKIKVLECLAAGLPVLTTEIGAEGIDATPDEGLIVLPPDPQRFLSELTALLKDSPRLARLSAGAVSWSNRQLKDHRKILLGQGHSAVLLDNY